MVGRLTIAAAGSGKTEMIVASALSSRRAAITTYTNSNTDEIRQRVRRLAGAIPPNVEVMNWCTFLFRHGVAPYQHFLELPYRIKQVSHERAPAFEKGKPQPARQQIARYYLDPGRRIYNTRVSDLACVVNDRSSGLVIQRMAQVYPRVFIDEAQDLAGWDIDLIEEMLTAGIEVHMVGDPRQRTYSTTDSTKNQSKDGIPLVVMRDRFEKARLIEVEVRDLSHRCHQRICDYADRLYPDLPVTRGNPELNDEHLGVFSVRSSQALAYASQFRPVNLRYMVTSNTQGLAAFNFGESKGSTFERVLIFPTKTMIDYLRKGTALAEETRARLYVALTRARYSVGIVIADKDSSLPETTLWE